MDGPGTQGPVVIFDLDGTLLDTESLSDEAMLRAVRGRMARTCCCARAAAAALPARA